MTVDLAVFGELGGTLSDVTAQGILSGDGKTFTFIASGLVPGQQYTFDIDATDLAGNQRIGDDTEFEVNATVTPQPPTNVTATAGNAQATVSWSAPASDGGSTITQYTVTSSPGGLTAIVDGTTLTAPVTGLTNGTSHTFTVTATNALGISNASAPSNAVTPLGPPDPPTNVTATAGQGQATVSWSAPAFDGGSPITQYTVTSSPGGLTATVDSTTLEATVTGLTPGVQYTLTVTATNALGTSAPAFSNAVIPTAPPPPTPTPTPTPTATSTLIALEVSPTNAAAAIATGIQFKAIGVFADGSTQDLTAEVTWASSNVAVATVDASGHVSALTAGTVTITVTHIATGLSDTSAVTVVPPSKIVPALSQLMLIGFAGLFAVLILVGLRRRAQARRRAQ